jgi:hypothetical protein
LVVAAQVLSFFVGHNRTNKYKEVTFMPVVVSVAQGGTGANTSSAALTALGAAPTAAYTQANNAYAAANTKASIGLVIALS